MISSYISDSSGMRCHKPAVNRRDIAILCLVIASIWLPRALALDHFVTIDEPRWLARSANFYHALTHGELANTYQSSHPGVTVMWAGTAGFAHHYPTYASEIKGQLIGLSSVEPFLRERGYEPIEVLAAGRTFLVLFITAALVGSFFVAVRLMGLQPALLGCLLIAFDPFHLALSRVLHMDALKSSMMLLSLLALLNYIYRGKQWGNLVVSGAAAGLAWLTRSPAFFLVPYVGLLLLIDNWREFRFEGRLFMQRLIRSFVVWMATGLAVLVLLWPAMWVNPGQSLLTVFQEALSAAGGHANPIFFNGDIIEGDPGLFFYPLTYLWRTTPVVLIGLILAIAGFALRRPPFSQEENRGWVSALAFFTLLFTIFMSLGAKKFERYLLPIHGPFIFIAVMGWSTFFQAISSLVTSLRIVRGGFSFSTFIPPILAGAMVLMQIFGALITWPYYFSYYNPLLGGAAKAPEEMMIGWGEGLDQAARYLNAKPKGEDYKVISWYASGPFDYFYQGSSTTLGFDANDLDEILSHDYVVLYAHQWQRGLPNQEVLAYFAELTPEYVVQINGIDYVQIYDVMGIRNQ